MTPDYPEINGVSFAPIPEFPGYAASTDGCIWSCWKRGWSCVYIGDKWSKLALATTGKGGYQAITLCRDGKRFMRRAHSLVALAFLGPPPPGMECCHDNGNTLDSSVANLRYDTAIGNQRDRVRHGTDCRGSKCKTSKLKAWHVRYIRDNPDGMMPSELADLLGVTTANISLIRKRKSWAHLP